MFTLFTTFRSKHVIAVDIDPMKIDYAYHNANIYGVVNQIDFIVGDFFLLAPTLKVLKLSSNCRFLPMGYVSIVVHGFHISMPQILQFPVSFNFKQCV